jgi:hypothetical protein
MANRERYENRRSYERPDRDRRDEGMLTRIKNDVKNWFESDDEDRTSSDREYSGRDYGYRAYEGNDYEGNEHERNLARHQDSWRGSSRYGNQDYSAQGYGDRHYGNRSGGRYGLRDRDFRDADYGERSYSSGGRGYEDRGYGGGDDYDDDQDTRYSGSRRQPRVLSGEYWATPGPHAGIGPRGFQRSPDSLKERVCERLEQAGHIDASGIEVAVENEEVTLTGSVPDREQKRLAEDCAESIRGVSDVHNRLTIRRGTDSASGSVATGANTGKTSGSQSKNA